MSEPFCPPHQVVGLALQPDHRFVHGRLPVLPRRPSSVPCAVRRHHPLRCLVPRFRRAGLATEIASDGIAAIHPHGAEPLPRRVGGTGHCIRVIRAPPVDPRPRLFHRLVRRTPRTRRTVDPAYQTRPIAPAPGHFRRPTARMIRAGPSAPASALATDTSACQTVGTSSLESSIRLSFRRPPTGDATAFGPHFGLPFRLPRHRRHLRPGPYQPTVKPRQSIRQSASIRRVRGLTGVSSSS